MQKNTKDSTTKKATTAMKTAVKKVDKQAVPKVEAKAVTKKNAQKRTTTKKVVANNVAKTTGKTTKSTATKAASKSTKKATTAKSKTASNSTKKPSSTKKAKKVEIIEYYDLPYRYNQTIVKILAQTPNTLFVYWDISDEDRNKYIAEYGENFFDHTVPVLIVHNKTMNYSFEIEVNDFANSWYFNINDSKCDYEIELGRRAKPNTIDLPDNYMHVISSNQIETPNNHILFEKAQKTLFFRNVKTNTTVSKDVSTFDFMKYAGRVYNIYNVYKEIYKHEELENLENLSSSKV